MIELIKVNKIRAWVIVELIVSVFMFQYFEEAKAIDYREEYDVYTLREDNGFSVFTYGEDDMQERLENLRLEDCTISIVEKSLYLDEANSLYMTDIVVCGEQYFLPVIKGAYPSQERLSTGVPCAVLGKELYKYTYNNNGKTFIDIRGEKYEVTGYVSAPNSGIYDNRVVLFYDCLGANVKTDLEYYYYAEGLTLIFNSENISIESMLEQLDLDDYTYVLDGFQRFVETESVDVKYRKYACLIYVFSVMNSVLIFYLWMLTKKREFAIKKAFGYSTFRLIYELFGELLFMLSIAVAFSELGLMVFNLLENELIWFSWDRFIFRLINVFKYTIITMPVLLIVPIIVLIKDNPLKLLTDKDV